MKDLKAINPFTFTYSLYLKEEREGIHLFKSDLRIHVTVDIAENASTGMKVKTDEKPAYLPGVEPQRLS